MAYGLIVLTGGHSLEVQLQFRDLTDYFLHFIIQNSSVIYIFICAILNILMLQSDKEGKPDPSQPKAQPAPPNNIQNNQNELESHQASPSPMQYQKQQQSQNNPSPESPQNQHNQQPNADPADPNKSPTQKIRKRKMKKQRKIRTLITKQKLLQMNKIFSQVLNSSNGQKQQDGDNTINIHGNVHWNLKNIAKHLNLGYSTILHKFRQFRAHKKVRAGALIASMQHKRKYKKSLVIENIIREAMAEKEFFTASQMTNYIQNRYHQRFSRSIISRHLGQMGYSYKNVSRGSCTYQAKCLKIKKLYAQAMRPLFQRNQTLMYVDEMSCCTNIYDGQSQTPKTISVLIISMIDGVIFVHQEEGFIDRNKFYDIIKDFILNLRNSPLCAKLTGAKDEIYLVTDASSIHRDAEHSAKLATMFIEQNTQIYYLPPNSPEFNPLEPLFQKIRDQLSSKVSTGQVHDYPSMWDSLDKILEDIKAEPTEDYFMGVYEETHKYMSKGKEIKK